MDEKKNWATRVLAVFPVILTTLSSPVSMIRQVVIGIIGFSWLRRNTQIRIEGEEKGLILIKPAVVNNVDELPGELLVEILCRLPARDLVQLKSVCRRWNAIISSPSLASMHLRNYTNGPAGSASQTLVVGEVLDYDGYTSVRLFSPHHHGDHVSSKAQYMESEMPIASGPCNGIFLMGHSKTEDFVRLWNPATGKSREIAVPPVRKNPNPELHYYESYGFGLDPATNDFKIVMVRHFTVPHPYLCSVIVASSSPEFPAQVMVYTPGTDTWRELEELQVKLHLLQVVQSYNYLNGFFFWVCISPVAALAFDLEKEVFRVVNDPVPVGNSTSSHGYWKQLLVYKDTLALFLLLESTGG